MVHEAFGHDQRHLRIQAERGGIVHEHRAGGHDRMGKLLGDVIFRRAQNEHHTARFARLQGAENDPFTDLVKQDEHPGQPQPGADVTRRHVLRPRRKDC